MMNCPDYGVAPGSYHLDCCDVERCPRCGHQLLSCTCIYEVNGLDVRTLEFEHPDIYENGPSQRMYDEWDNKWGHRRMPWTGEWPGLDEARALGLYTKWTDHGWEPCDQNDEGAQGDLNTLVTIAHWDTDSQRWVASN